MTRSEHMQWCKDRAMEYVNCGDVKNAYSSMASDLSKHPETDGHIGIQLGLMQMMSGGLNTAAQMRSYIDGFN